MRLRVHRPDKTLAADWTFGPDPQLVKDGVGRYRAAVDVGFITGEWTAYANSTGAGQGSEEVKFTVRAAKNVTS